MNKENIESPNQKRNPVKFLDSKAYSQMNNADKALYELDSNPKTSFLKRYKLKEVESPNVQEGKIALQIASYEYSLLSAGLGSASEDFEAGAQWQASQSQHSHTEAIERIKDLRNQIHELEVRNDDLQNELEMIKGSRYSEAGVLAIIEQVKEKCADDALVENVSYGITIIDKQSITDIDFKYLLK